MPEDQSKKFITQDKVMDVAMPGEAPASPTKRPIIVPGRSMVDADPMMMPASDNKDTNAKTEDEDLVVDPVKVALEPVDRSAEQSDSPDESSVNVTEADFPQNQKAPTESQPEIATENPSETADNSEPSNSQSISSGVAAEADNKAAQDDAVSAGNVEESTSNPAQQNDVAQGASAHREKVLSPLSVSENGESNEPVSNETVDKAEKAVQETGTPTSKTEPSDLGVDDEESPYQGDRVPDSDMELTAREAELMGHIDKGTFSLPISQPKSRTEKVLIAAIITMVLLLLTLNVLLDLGTISIPGAPHTDFLG